MKKTEKPNRRPPKPTTANLATSLHEAASQIECTVATLLDASGQAGGVGDANALHIIRRAITHLQALAQGLRAVTPGKPKLDTPPPPV
jgi:hypothetical protein